MLFLTGNELKNYIEEMTNDTWEKRDFVLKLEKYLHMPSRRGVLLTGLRSTGKTIGILQAIKKCDMDKTVYFSPVDNLEHITGREVWDLLKVGDYDRVVIDEYSWIEDGDGVLSNYLAGLSQMGKKVFITGTDSCKVKALENTDFIHRSIDINTTFFSYAEYLRIWKEKKSPDSMKRYLLSGGVFENGIARNFKSLKNYIQSAIIDNLASYYSDYRPELIKAVVYTLFYDCISNLYNGKEKKVPVYNLDKDRDFYVEYLNLFNVDPTIIIPPSLLWEISSELEKIGVLIKLKDLRIPAHERSYITNQTISAMLVKTIFDLKELPDKYLGHLYEASIVCNTYMKWVYGVNAPYEMYFLHGRKGGEDYEIDFILTDRKESYLFECKYSENSKMTISTNASLVKDMIPQLLGDREVCGRAVLYRGEEKWENINGLDVLFTDDWDIDFPYFRQKLEEEIER
jgi:hypothetical protein